MVDIIPITAGDQYLKIKTKKRKYLVFKKPTCPDSVFTWLFSVRCAVDFPFCPILKEHQSGPSPASIYNRCTRTHWATSRFKTRRAPPNHTGSWSVSSSTRPVPPPSNAGCSHCKVIHNRKTIKRGRGVKDHKLLKLEKKCVLHSRQCTISL